jgi:hypothetical protein
MSERENLGAGIYATLSVLVVLVCLIGALVLPPSLFTGKWLGIVALSGLFVGILGQTSRKQKRRKESQMRTSSFL